jgi:hypothetical protein
MPIGKHFTDLPEPQAGTDDEGNGIFRAVTKFLILSVVVIDNALDFP